MVEDVIVSADFRPDIHKRKQDVPIFDYETFSDLLVIPGIQLIQRNLDMLL